jgi:hypothetical protein
MPFLAVTRAGVASVAQATSPMSSLWVGADVLSEVEVQHLRASGVVVSVFIHSVRTREEIEDAVPTLSEHHPGEPVWVESLPENYNPRSSEVGQAFLWHEFIVGVNYQHNESVVVVSGPHSGERGSLVSLVSLHPEPEFSLEAESGQDIHVRQSNLLRADA